MSNDTVQRIEENIRQAKVHVEFDRALQRLIQNRDFDLVIKQGYLRDEAIRLVHLKADPSMQSETSQRSIVSQMDAIGGLLSYFRLVGQQAEQAFKVIESGQAEIEEIHAEENQ